MHARKSASAILSRVSAAIHTCETASIELRTLQRWQAHEGLTAGDGRRWPCAPYPGHALSHDKRAQLLLIANEARFTAVPPARIVPMLADESVYLASESRFGRVLRAQGQTTHRGRARWGAGT